ncbi:unnamed protein product, partial [Coregonus sp. 'balchen']
MRLRQRLVILERYLISLSHSMMEEKYKVRWKIPPSPPLPIVDNKSARPASKGVEGLARVGSRAALSFAFAFLRRAWRSEATLFDEGTVSSVWLEVVERATKFLSDVHGSGSTKGSIPLQDQHLALAILLELAVQRGTLSQLLSAILGSPLSPNESFLRYLTLPQDNDLAIDLRQTAVVIMAHLDRLAAPCSPPQCSSPTSHKGTLQEVIGWGLLGWKLYANVNGPVQCKALSGLGVSQIVCSEKGFLILASSGAVYTQNYKSTTL